MKVYKTKIVEEDGDIAFEFPDELMESFDLQIGDTFEWTAHAEYVILKKIENEDSSS